MRRLLSTILTLIIGLSPILAATIEIANSSLFAFGWSQRADESQLPACCRRNGKHHCSLNSRPLASQASVAGSEGQPTISAHETCPFAPPALSPNAPTHAALAVAGPGADTFPIQALVGRALALAVKLSGRRTQPQRGPPTTTSLQSV